MLRSSFRPVALASLGLAFTVAACDDFVRVPDTSVESVSYVVTAARYNRAVTPASPLASRVAIEYTTPDGVKNDTISGTLVSWSKLFANADGFSPRLTAQVLEPTATAPAGITNSVGIRLKVGTSVMTDSTSGPDPITVSK